MTKALKFPEELKRLILQNKRNYRAGESLETRKVLADLRLNTVCESALCPNRGKCFGERVATFLILGKDCTRGCSFCAVDRGRPEPPDPTEPDRVAEAASRLGLKYIVITSPTRDDLPDGGAAHYAAVISKLRRALPEIKVEALVPDFAGSEEALAAVLESRPTVLSHNLETVPSLYAMVRKGADYGRSLGLIAAVKKLAGGVYSKSGIMVGMGETAGEILSLMRDLRAASCDIVTIGQYIAPSPANYPVKEYVDEKTYKMYEEEAYKMGFLAVASSALVRSSYLAETTFGVLTERKGSL